MNSEQLLLRLKASIFSLTGLLIGIILFGTYAFGNLSKGWEEVFRVFGEIIIPTALVGFIYEVFLREHFVQQVSHILRVDFGKPFLDALEVRLIIVLANKFDSNFVESVAEEITFSLSKEIHILTNLWEKGIMAYYSHLSVDKVAEQISRAQDSVQILQTWIPGLEQYRQGLRQASHNNSKIQILLIDPNSKLAEQRSEDLGFGEDKQYVRRQVESNIADLKRLHEQEKLNLEVKLYNSLPSMQLYRIDDDAYMGFFLQGRLSEESPQLAIKGLNANFGRHIIQEFNQVWIKAKQVI